MSVAPPPIVPIEPLKALAAELTGLQAVWITEPRPKLGLMTADRPMAYLVLSANSLVGGGQDTRTGTDDDGQPVTAIVSSDAITLSIRCTSIDPRYQAFDILTRLRAQLRGFKTQTARALYRFAIVRMASLTPLPNATLDNRAAFVANLDVILRLAVSIPLDDDDHATIDTVNDGGPIEGTLDP